MWVGGLCGFQCDWLVLWGFFFYFFFFFVWLDAGVDLVAQWGAEGVNLNDVGCLMMVAMWVVLGL